MTLYISPPFGNYLSYKNAVRIKGTFTWKHRKGLIYHTARSLRPVAGGWRNQIGFRNKGIKNVLLDPNHVHSIGGLEWGEWESLLEFVPAHIPIELNIGCPNVSGAPITTNMLKKFVDKFPRLQVKLPPDQHASRGLYHIERMLDAGIKSFHLSNTIPAPKGGISGKQLKDINLHIVEKSVKCISAAYAHEKGAEVHIIAGGGIYNKEDLNDYRNAGATDFSISTVYLSRPYNIPAIYAAAIRDITT